MTAVRSIQDVKLVIFADNINILIINQNTDTMQERINMIKKQFQTWFSSNGLIINVNKTSAMLVDCNQTCTLVKPKIFTNNAEICYTSEVKFLGISISNKLKWNSHTQILCSKLNNIFYMITLLRDDLSLFMLRSIYFAIFQPLIRYGIIL
jgi:hypothetical protein